jgi:hypothetical protein
MDQLSAVLSILPVQKQLSCDGSCQETIVNHFMFRSNDQMPVGKLRFVR